MNLYRAGGSSSLPPGPRGVPLLGVLPELRRDPLGLLWRASRDYGDVTSLPLGSRRIILLCHPDHVQHVLLQTQRTYRKSSKHQLYREVLGESLFIAEGEVWARQRRTMNHSFRPHEIDAAAGMIVEAISFMLDRWEAIRVASGSIDVFHEMSLLTLDVIARMMFGARTEHTEGVGDAVNVLSAFMHRRWLLPIRQLEWLTPQFNRRYHRAHRLISGIVWQIIRERQCSGPTNRRRDLLAALIDSRDEETARPLSDQELHDQVLTIYLTGHETTAITLCWAFYLLAQHPDVDAQLADEIANVTQGRIPSVDEVPRLTFTRMVLEETMRLYPPAWNLTRDALQDDEIGGYEIPAGTTVILSPFVTHRDPRFWEDPDAFRPERFAPEHARARHRFAYFPFGAGPRKCIGEHMAFVEAMLVLAMTRSRYQLHLTSGKLQPQPLITLRPGGVVRMTIGST